MTKICLFPLVSFFSLSPSTCHSGLKVSGEASPIYAHHPTRPQDGQSNGHFDAILNNIQLTSTDLVPLNRHLGDLDARTSANNTAIATQDGSGRGRLGKHQHLNVEDPAFGMHVGDNVWQRGAGEELEAALGVADARCGRRREDGENEVE